MAKGNSQQNAAPFSDFLNLIEKEAGLYLVELLPIVDKNEIVPHALLVLNYELSENRKNKFKKAIASANKGTTREEQAIAMPQNVAFRHLGAENFIERVRAELLRVVKSRLPCSLLLIRFSGYKDGNFSKNAIATLTKELGYSHHLPWIDDTTLALLLPGQNKNRALSRARAIHQSLLANTTCRILIGLAFCLAGEVPEPEEFINMALTELKKGEHGSGDIFCTFNDQDDSSCQVTAEERAQLLCFSNRGKKI